jgi:hypothetical protein
MVEIGRLMTGKYLPTEAASIAKRVDSGQELQAAASAVLGMSYQELGVELAARWNLPETLRSVINGTGDPLLVGIARFASAASSLIHEGKLDAVTTLLGNLDLPGIDKPRLGALVGRKVEAARLLPATQHGSSVEASLHDLQQQMLDKKGSLEGLAQAMLPALSATLKTSHCLLFMLTRSGEQRVRHGAGRGIDELRSKLKVSADFLPTAFHAAIKKNIDVSIADVSKLKDASLPEGYRAMLPQVRRFIILPIATTRVTGLLYCDWDSEGTLNPAEIEALKSLRNLFLPLFPQ